MKKYIKQLTELKACPEAIHWAKQYDTLQEAWDNCGRGDWMLWYLGRIDKSKPYSEERKPLVRAAVRCAKLAWRLVPKESKQYIELCERWIDGEDIPKSEFETAAYAADVAANAAADAAQQKT